MGTPIPAIVHAPLTYLKEGKQVVIPLNALAFEGGELTVKAEFSDAQPWLNSLVSAGIISPAPPDAKPAQAAMVLRARVPSSTGNDIQIKITDSTPSTFNIQVTQKNVYPDLRPAELPEVLGTELRGGTRPGLVRIKHQAEPLGLPDSSTPLSNELKGKDATTRGSWEVPTKPSQPGSKPAFTLESRDPSEEPIQVTLKCKPAEGTLTLEASWTKTQTNIGSSASDIQTALEKFGYVLTFSAPEKGKSITRPRSGTFTLRGGQDSTFASFVPSAKQS